MIESNTVVETSSGPRLIRRPVVPEGEAVPGLPVAAGAFSYSGGAGS